MQCLDGAGLVVTRARHANVRACVARGDAVLRTRPATLLNIYHWG